MVTAPPSEANTDDRATTKKTLYFNAPDDDSFDIKPCKTRTSETAGTN